MAEPKRKANGESTIYFGADGWWHGRVTVGVKADGSEDRRHRRGRTEEEVKAKVEALEKARDSGPLPKAGRVPTVAKWFDEFLNVICARRVEDGSMAPRTLDDYRSKFELYILPGIGKHRLDRLAPGHLDHLYLGLTRRGLSSGTVLKTHRIVSRALTVAMQREVITRNVAKLVEAPSVDEVDLEPLTRDEARRVLAEAGRRRNGERWAVGLAQGLRQGEALGLRWAYVDLDAGVMRVWWQLQRLAWRHGCEDAHACGEKHHRAPCPANCRPHAHYKRGCPKPCPPGCQKHAKACPERTGGGLVIRRPKGKKKRTLSIAGPLAELLRAVDARQTVERETAGDAWQENDLVFCRPDGRPIDPRDDWEEWKDILEAAGIRDLRVHDGRHTTGTLLVESGVPLRVVMEILGHSSMRMTQRYTHVASPVAAAAASALGVTLWGEDEPVTGSD